VNGIWMPKAIVAVAGLTVPGYLDAHPGIWGARRQPVAMVEVV